MSTKIPDSHDATFVERAEYNGERASGGVTKRELFAAMAMQGLCVRSHPKYEDGPCNAAIAERAVRIADALLLALEEVRP